MSKFLHSFRHYEALYGSGEKFGRRMSSKQISVILFLSMVLHYSGLSFLFKKALKPRILSFLEEDIYYFVFGFNHKAVYSSLCASGFSWPSIEFLSESTSLKKLQFGNHFIHFMALLNYKVLKDELHGIDDEILKNNSYRLFKLVGLDWIYEVLLTRVKVVIKFNDHIHYSVYLYDLAQSKGVKCVYIQHAPVSYRFPKLYHEYNLLFSEDSLSKYSPVDPGVKYEVICDLRMIDRLRDNDFSMKLSKLETVLICPNTLDDIGIVKSTIKLLGGKRIIVRPHPADKREWNLVDLSNQTTFVELSQGNTIWFDIDRTDCILANESAVLLEGIVANKYVYKCSFWSKALDNYSFIKKGLIQAEYYSNEDLLKAIESKEISYDPDGLKHFVGDYQDFEKKINEIKDEILSLRN